MKVIVLKDILKAKETIAPYIIETPLLSANLLKQNEKHQLFVKAEHMQQTGSFKVRGAMNMIAKIKETGCTHVVSASSGNHGQAVAYAAKTFGLKATIIVPENVTAIKKALIESHGAVTIKHGLTSEHRIHFAKRHTEENDSAVFIPPYDHPLVMAGQGTIGLEILKQIGDLDTIYVPIGGGGLISGILTAIKETKPNVKVIGVEPEVANDTYLSLQKGKAVEIDAPSTIADGLRTTRTGEKTLPIILKYIDEIVLVRESEIKLTLKQLLTHMKQIIEPSAAVAVAAMLKNNKTTVNNASCAVISGGNISLSDLAHLTK